MIMQGTNAPLTLEFDDTISTSLDISVLLYQGNKTLKRWTKDDVTLSDSIVQCPITQEESLLWNAGDVWIEAKWLDSNNVTQFSDRIKDKIVARQDHTILG